jgi:TetR/AcrR family transcriptional repressor of nem operon
MPRVSREQADINRASIEASSIRLFKERGLDGVSVNDVMGAAGLTHGGFYGHFESKDALAEWACAAAFDASVANWQALLEQHPEEPAFIAAVAESYLNQEKRDHPGAACPAWTLGTDVARQSPEKPVRQRYLSGVKRLLDLLCAGAGARRTKQMQREAAREAMCRLSMMVGAMTLSRALNGDPLSDEFLAAARESLAQGAGKTRHS